MYVTFGGRYRLQVHHGDTDILLHDTGWFDNLITDNGLDLLGTGFTPSCYVSSDTAAPSTSDTSIANILGSTSTKAFYNRTSQLATPPYYWSEQSSFTFAIGAVQGTIGQVAIGHTSSNLFSKAQLTESGGSPTTLTLSGVDRLTLYYELRQYIRSDDVSHTIDINGVSYDCLNRAAYISDTTWAPVLGRAIGTTNLVPYYYVNLYTGGTTPFVGAITGAPSGSVVQSTGITRASYISGTHTLGMTSYWDTSRGTITNVTAVVLAVLVVSGSMGGRWQSSIEGPTLSKTAYQSLALEWQYSWGRI